MAAIKELIRKESDNTISFGDYTLDKKTKLDNFEYQGDLYKVKTFGEITKLEKNGSFVYESVPGTAVEHLKETEKGMEFKVEGPEDVQLLFQELIHTQKNHFSQVLLFLQMSLLYISHPDIQNCLILSFYLMYNLQN